jgi:hypothetical protein
MMLPAFYSKGIFFNSNFLKINISYSKMIKTDFDMIPKADQP